MKKLVSFMTVLLLTCSVCMTALAEGEASKEPALRDGTAASLKSYGAIVYQKGEDTMRIDSEDLYMLADQIDQVKLDVTNQLEAMNTFFTSGEGLSLNTNMDINVVHAQPFEEDSVDPLDVNFDTLLEGIAVSQSVSSDAAAYGYPAGTEFYKSTDGFLTTDEGEGAEQVSVTAASADSLSAGMAAWVDGKLILGTGGDNKSYYDKGKQDSVQKIVFSLYNNKTKKYQFPSRSARVSKYITGNDTKTGSFSYNSDPLYLYQDMDGNTAALNTISFVLTGNQAHGSGQPCHCILGINITANLYLEDGSLLYTHTFNRVSGGTTSENITINIFDYAVGENTYCYLSVKGNVSLKTVDHVYTSGVSYIEAKFDNAYASYIPIDVD